MSTDDVILLAWRRHKELVNDEHLNSGYIVVGEVRDEFKSLPYHELITKVAVLARKNLTAKIFFARLEQSTPQPIELSGKDSKLLREDPVAYIRSTILERRIVLGSPRAPPQTVGPRPLRAGIDALAETFGDTLYFPVRKGRVENVWTGRWGDVDLDVSDYEGMCNAADALVDFTYGNVPLNSFGVVRTPRTCWLTVRTEVLLKIGAQHKKMRHYLPREWNTSGPWITHEALQEQYDKYCEEKKACSNTAAHKA